MCWCLNKFPTHYYNYLVYNTGDIKIRYTGRKQIYTQNILINSYAWLNYWHLHICNLMLFLFGHQVVSYSLWPRGLQHDSLLCTPLSPGVCSNSCELVIPSYHLILYRPLLLLPSIFPSIRIFSNELALCIRWPKHWKFSFSISPSNEYKGWFPIRLTGLISLQSKGLSRVFSSTTIWKHQFFGTQPSLQSNSHIHTP